MSDEIKKPAPESNAAQGPNVSPDMLARGIHATAAACSQVMTILHNVKEHKVAGAFDDETIQTARLIEATEEALARLAYVGAALTGALGNLAGIRPEDIPEYVSSVVHLDRAEKAGQRLNPNAARKTGLMN